MTRLDGAALLKRLPQVRGRLEANAPLADLTWFRAGGPAEVLFTPADEADLARGHGYLSLTAQRALFIDTVDVAQIRSELSYVFGYHEFGYWGAQNILNQNSFLLPRQTNPITGTSVDFYSAFYRLHFGDANEWRFWGGATSTGDGIIGSSIRAPMSRSFGIEGAFTYLIPKEQTTVTIGGLGSSASFNPAAWNLSVNFVYYPAGRSRRGLASPYRPLFDVADNGSLIRSSAP